MLTMARMQVTPLVGRSTVDVWADVYSFRLPDGCELVCVASLSGEHAHQAGRELFTQLQAYRYISPEQLYDAITGILGGLSVEAASQSCAVVLKTTTTYFCLALQATILLQRRGKWKTILSESQEWNMVGGAAEAQDTIVLLTQTAMKPAQQTLHEYIPFSVELFAARLMSKLQAETTSSGAACACVEYLAEEPRKSAALTSLRHFVFPQHKKFAVVATLLIFILAGIFAVTTVWQKKSASPTTPFDPVAEQPTAAPQFRLPTQYSEELSVVYDMRLAVPDFVATYAAAVGTAVFAVDTQKQTAILIETTTKQVRVKADPLFAQTQSVTAHPEKGFFILGQGISNVALEGDIQLQQVKEEGDSNKDARVIAAYGPYVYVLNPAKRAVYRYAEQKETYSNPIGWLQDPLGLGYDDVVSIVVDGSVWMSSNKGTIKKFTSGKTESFSLTGCDPEFAHSVFLATSEESSNLYILDPSEKRVVVVDKNGACKRQLVSPALAAAYGISIGQTGEKVVVVSGSLLYEMTP